MYNMKKKISIILILAVLISLISDKGLLNVLAGEGIEETFKTDKTGNEEMTIEDATVIDAISVTENISVADCAEITQADIRAGELNENDTITEECCLLYEGKEIRGLLSETVEAYSGENAEESAEEITKELLEESTETTTEEATGESAKESTEAMVITGTIGDNNGFEWTYDAESKTLTVTGEDSGIEGNYNEGSQFNSICSDVVTVIFKDCKIKGSMECVLRKLAYLENVDFINVDTSDVTNMSFMFALCEKLKNADLSELDTYNVTTLIGLFYNCISLECVDIEGIDTSNVTTMQSLFYNCSNLENVDVSGFNTSKVTDLGYVFYGCNKLTNINVSNWSTSNVTSMYSLFANCENLKTLDVSNFDTSKVINMGFMFYGCSKLEELNVSGFKTSNVTSMEAMFYKCSSLKSIDVSGFDTSNVIKIKHIFQDCYNVESLDVSKFDVSNAESVAAMFYNCKSLTSINVSNFNTAKTESMSYMFYGCSNLTELDLSKFDTSNVKTMQSMFYKCSNLSTLNLSNFDTSKVETMAYMFLQCNNLVNLDLSSFDTSNLKYMNYMFYKSNNLKYLNINSFDMSKVEEAKDCLGFCESLETIYTPKLITGEMSLGLPYEFYDEACNSVSVITADYCNMILTKTPNKLLDTSLKVMLNGVKTINGTNVVKWITINDADGYEILRRSLKSEAWKVYADIEGGDVVRFEDTEVVADIRYYYTVKAYSFNNAGNKMYSKFDNEGLGVITSVEAVKLTDISSLNGKNTINWEPVAGVQGYVVKRKSSDGSKWITVEVLKGENRNTYTDSKAIYAGKDYTYTVFAMGKKQNGERNYGGFDKTGLTVKASVKTVSLKSAYAGPGRNVVTWNKVNGAEGYEILRKEAGTSKWKTIATIKNSTALKYNDTAVSAGTTYDYTVKAFYMEPSGNKVYGAYDVTGKNVTAK